jgi:hypothetical protein
MANAVCRAKAVDNREMALEELETTEAVDQRHRRANPQNHKKDGSQVTWPYIGYGVLLQYFTNGQRQKEDSASEINSQLFMEDASKPVASSGVITRHCGRL